MFPFDQLQDLASPEGAVVVLLVLLFGAGAVLHGIYHAGRGSGSLEDQRENSRRWARPRDVPDLVVDEPLAERAVIGTLRGRRLAMPSLESVLVLAPTGMGKTSRFVVPTILRWKGAAVVTSVKGDAVALTLEHRKAQGPVWVFDPTGASGLPASSWSPLATADTYAGAMKAAAWLTDSSQVEKVTNNEQQLWATLGEQLLAPLLFAARRTHKGMADIADWILFRREDEVAALLEDLGDRDAMGHWAAVTSAEGRTKQSIFVTAQRIMHVYAHPDIREALSGGDGKDMFDPDVMLTAGGTLYVVAPAGEQELFTPVFETLLNCVVRAVERRSAEAGGLPISPRLLLMLEEAANCAPLRRLPAIASAGRGQGIQTVSIWQDEGQIETIYGSSKTRTIVANHTCLMVLPGVKDTATLRRIEDLIGPDRFRVDRRTVTNGSASTSWDYESLPLAPAEYIRELNEGLALAVISNRKPIKLRTVAWYEDDDLRRLVGAAAAPYDAAFGKKKVRSR